MSGPRRPGGFTLLELTIVLVLTGLVMAIAGLTFSGYFQRSSARRAAQVFARDLSLARSTALRSRSKVVIRFDETNRWYQIVSKESGSQIVRRRFGEDADVALSGINLMIAGDSLVFNVKGVADLSDIQGSSTTLGEATFMFGAIRYTVFFNSLGASMIEEG